MDSDSDRARSTVRLEPTELCVVAVTSSFHSFNYDEASSYVSAARALLGRQLVVAWL